MNGPTRTWLVLVALTAAAMAAGGRDGGTLGLAGAALVIAAAGLKAVAILHSYLELRRASPGWRVFFYGYLAGVGLLVFAAFAMGGRPA